MYVLRATCKVWEVLRAQGGGERGVWVRGSGLIYVPLYRVNEVGRVVEESYRAEAEIQKLALFVRRIL